MAKEEILEHVLVPEHKKLSKAEKSVLLKKYFIDETKLPVIKMADPAIKHLEVVPNDVIVINRKSLTAGRINFFRRVVDE
jgi:DNA-directed RNA polymerase subunit H (RpoH/RPB5)